MAEGNTATITMTRGQLAKAAGCNLETVRYYEQIALMPQPRRSSSGHRLYGVAERRRLGFILRARRLGFSIEELRSLLHLVDEDDGCEAVRALTLRHVAKVRGRIAELRRMERRLADLAERCAADDPHGCPIIDTLFADDD